MNWIRALSRRDRWTEELLLLESEMQWYLNFMSFCQTRAGAWARLDLGEGHKAYALREADTWRRYGMEGMNQFNGKEGDRIFDDVRTEEGDDTQSMYNPNDSFE